MWEQSWWTESFKVDTFVFSRFYPIKMEIIGENFYRKSCKTNIATLRHTVPEKRFNPWRIVHSLPPDLFLLREIEKDLQASKTVEKIIWSWEMFLSWPLTDLSIWANGRHAATIKKFYGSLQKPGKSSILVLVVAPTLPTVLVLVPEHPRYPPIEYSSTGGGTQCAVLVLEHPLVEYQHWPTARNFADDRWGENYFPRSSSSSWNFSFVIVFSFGYFWKSLLRQVKFFHHFTSSAINTNCEQYHTITQSLLVPFH